MTGQNAKLILDGKEYQFPVVVGSENEKAIDISQLRAQTGYVTLDNGFMNTGACTSAITFLDGEQGILRYRGIDIAELAEKSTFTEVSSLLINGKLPSQTELSAFEEQIQNSAALPAGIFNILKQFPKDAHPMCVLSSLISALSAYYPELTKTNLTADDKVRIIPMLMKQLKVIAAAQYRHSIGKDFIRSDSKNNYCEDFLSMMFGEKADPKVAKALDVLLILHADHEQNCSTSTVRMVGSSKANLFASVSAGVEALWGPLHGGANQQVVEMLEKIHQDGGGHKKFINMAKDKNSDFLLMGFGHRVYKNFDPRARIIKKATEMVLAQLGVNDPLLDIAKGLEEEALKDSYFVERKLYPNVDFYSGIIYRALGIPTGMFTVMFALGRLPGWIAQWKEMIESPAMRICRPRQIYTGEKLTPYKK